MTAFGWKSLGWLLLLIGIGVVLSEYPDCASTVSSGIAWCK